MDGHVRRFRSDLSSKDCTFTEAAEAAHSLPSRDFNWRGPTQGFEANSFVLCK